MRLFYLGIYNNLEPQNGLRRALRSISSAYDETDWNSAKKQYGKNFETYIVNRINNFSPDVVFMQIQNPNIITPSIAKQLQGIKINWTGDVREDISWFKELAPFVNVTLFTNMTDVHSLQLDGLKSDFLQVSVDEEIYKHNGQYVEFAPIVFFGNNYKNHFPLSAERFETVRRLKKDYGNKFAIFGTGWNGLESGNLNHKQQQEAMILRGAKIALSISHFNYERYFSDRLLRAMFCGCMVVSHAYKKIETDFRQGEHLVWYSDYEHLTKVIDNALSNPFRQTQVSSQGYQHVKQHFSYSAFAKNLLHLINKYK
jgi:spore maturation protein CgeB